MTANLDIQNITFKCDKGHRWTGQYWPKVNHGTGILATDSWKCPDCSDYGAIAFIECPDTYDVDCTWLIPIGMEHLKHRHFNVDLLIQIAKQIVSDELRLNYGGISIHRTYDIYAKEDCPRYKREQLTAMWMLQDVLDLIKEMLED